ncbi:unnamed protein product [Closterium sp. Yama58-4]|nr:unnamed protein product [Closterium sp. Yama58-4]
MVPASALCGSFIVQHHLRFSFNVLLGVMTAMFLQDLAYRVSAPFFREASSGIGDIAMVKFLLTLDGWPSCASPSWSTSSGYVTYLPLHRILTAAYNVFPEQNGATLHYLREYRNASTWVLFCDVDEFIFEPRNLRAGFLFRFMRNVSLVDPSVTQVLAPNIFFVGNSEAPCSSLLFRHFSKCQHLAEWREYLHRSKPMVRVAAVEQWADIRVASHFFPMAVGATERADPSQLRMHHYWGPRGTRFGAETRGFAKEVEKDLTIHVRWRSQNI